MLVKSLVVAGILSLGVGAAQAGDSALTEAGIAPLDVVGFSESVPKGMPLFAALPRMAPGAESDVRDVGMSGLVAFGTQVPSSLDPNADIATGSVKE
ncbi:hypothetical protein [Methylobacterium isbiliense]|uniref:Uncharacterized protein n=1 Tax=Methylobacterium isbiliense TaxID=315478 RepID=A0ABQ4S9Z0_9HYPH|nr:hypothetical protein [Methylobacterium isbiliense]MDN3627659.1 hypothetical protein [Methylobacterium isbiliense]GJD99984.1 hypothetical protein GMJLKIPL_1902 [Methylobacterium isbiliense]